MYQLKKLGIYLLPADLLAGTQVQLKHSKQL